jgi:hypothetical protein
VTLTLTPYGGSRLGSWEGCDSNPQPLQCQLTMNANRVVTLQIN